MNPDSPHVFRSTGQRGYCAEVAALPQRVFARKTGGQVKVEFAREPGSLQTREGRVQVCTGDAIVTSERGDRWRVSIVHFADKYRAVPPTSFGSNGPYAAFQVQVAAAPMTAPFQVLLADGQSVLQGRPGDWLIDYGDGSLGVISPENFAANYRLET